MKIEVFEIADGKWFWHFKSKGRITANGESHNSRGHAMRAAKSVVRSVYKSACECGKVLRFESTPPTGEGTVTVRWW